MWYYLKRNTVYEVKPSKYADDNNSFVIKTKIRCFNFFKFLAR